MCSLVYAGAMAPKHRPTAVLDPGKCREMVSTCACFNFRKASRSVTQLFDQILAPVGLRSTQLVILVASQVIGPCGLARLARELVMDRSTITRNLHPLVTHGFLQITGKSGRAGKSVQITEAGQQVLVQAVPYWEEAQQQLVQNLGRQRWERVMGDLSTVVNATRSSG
jgi:DNA-binding MarR family transcriptional regulator